MKWIIVFVIMLAPAGYAQDKGTPSQEEVQKRWAAAATPSAGHARLNDLVGTWESVSNMWVSGPDAAPTVSKGKSVFTWELGGRFLRQDATGEMMGQTVSGIGYTGYDNSAKRYFTFWMDNTSTAMYMADGVFDPSGNVLTMYGKMDDLATDERQKNVKYVMRFVSKDEYRSEIHDLSMSEGKTMVVEAVCKRVK